MVRPKNPTPLKINTHPAARAGGAGGAAGGATKSPILLQKMRTAQKRHWRPGTVALREIKKEQKSTALAIPPVSFQREFRKAAERAWKGVGQIRAQKSAVVALQHASEAYLVDIFTVANEIAILRDHQTVLDDDLKMATKMVKGGYKA